jgi:hypothetical protein
MILFIIIINYLYTENSFDLTKYLEAWCVATSSFSLFSTNFSAFGALQLVIGFCFSFFGFPFFYLVGFRFSFFGIDFGKKKRKQKSGG